MQTQTISTGTVFKGSYGTSYDAGADRVINVTEKSTKRGRPAAPVAPVYFQTNDLFGRVPATAPNNIKGVVIKGIAGEE